MPQEIAFIPSHDLVDYPDALKAMETRVQAIHENTAKEALWFLEHPPLYTSGTSAREADLLSQRFPIYKAGRGGEYTYHGPGQRVAYVMLNLYKHPSIGVCDVRAYVKALETWLIRTLAHFGITGHIREGRVGVWVDLPGGSEAKIAAIGIRIRRWVTFHGIALNVHPDLEHFSGIVPCGIKEFGVTSLHDLGVNASMEDVDEVLKREFAELLDAPLTLSPGR